MHLNTRLVRERSQEFDSSSPPFPHYHSSSPLHLWNHGIIYGPGRSRESLEERNPFNSESRNTLRRNQSTEYDPRNLQRFFLRL